MSSACVCHLKEWCFYCEMYSPLESKFELQEAENAALKQEIEQLKVRTAWDESNVAMFADQVEKLLSEKNQLKADKAELLKCVKWYAERKNYSRDDQGFRPAAWDSGQQARDCLTQIGGSQ